MLQSFALQERRDFEGGLSTLNALLAKEEGKHAIRTLMHAAGIYH